MPKALGGFTILAEDEVVAVVVLNSLHHIRHATIGLLIGEFGNDDLPGLVGIVPRRGPLRLPVWPSRRCGR